MIVYVSGYEKVSNSQTEGSGPRLVLSEANTGCQVRIFGRGTVGERRSYLTKLLSELKKAAPTGGYVHLIGDIAPLPKRLVNTKTGVRGTLHIPCWMVSVAGTASEESISAAQASIDAQRNKAIADAMASQGVVEFDTSGYTGAASKAAETTVVEEASVNLPA